MFGTGLQGVVFAEKKAVVIDEISAIELFESDESEH